MATSKSSNISAGVVLESLKKKSVTTISKLEVLVIKSEDAYDTAAGYLIKLKELSKEADAKRKEITDPLNQALKATNALFKPFINRIEELEHSTKSAMVDFLNRKEAEAKKLEEKFHNGDIKKISTLKARQDELKVESGNVSVRQLAALKINDLDAIPRMYMVPNEALILEALKQNVKIKGCELIYKKSLAI